MHNENILILSSIILLVSLFCRIKGDSEVIKEQTQIASRPQPENNLDRIPDESVITTVDDEKFDDNELRKLFVQNFKLHENSGREKIVNGTVETARITRDALNDASKHEMECVSCFGTGSSKADSKCYDGTAPRIKCSDAEQCFMELNPKYLRRGCMLTARLNRTFYCRCPLCNSKPSTDNTYYDYTTYDDWAYDNFLLLNRQTGADLMCKVCETTGTNPLSDKKCKEGQSADHIVCTHNQLCFINIDDEIDHVSRGCRAGPAFNSMYYFCNETGCNAQAYKSPKLTFRTLALAKTTKNTAKKSSSGKLLNSSNLILACILLVLNITVV